MSKVIRLASVRAGARVQTHAQPPAPATSPHFIFADGKLTNWPFNPDFVNRWRYAALSPANKTKVQIYLDEQIKKALAEQNADHCSTLAKARVTRAFTLHTQASQGNTPAGATKARRGA